MFTAKSLSYAFAHKNLFQNLSFELAPGEALHLAGPNGSGKSTLLEILAGIRRTASGEASYHGEKDLRKWTEYLPPEGNGLFLKLDSWSNLETWASLGGSTPGPARITKALEEWGLSRLLGRRDLPVEKFSTGMKRRLGLARLTLADAPILLLDEPLLGLDQNGTEFFRQVMARKKAEGTILILASHDVPSLEGLITKSLNLGDFR